MSLTIAEIELVKSSWGVVLIKKDLVGDLFYGKLFEIAPGVRHLFKSDIKDQAGKLVSMVTVIVTKLDKMDDLLTEVSSLAKRHNKYGTQSAHYGAVGEALIYTLKTGLAERWTSDTEKAWIKVYQVLSKAMIEAQQKTAA